MTDIVTYDYDKEFEENDFHFKWKKKSYVLIEANEAAHMSYQDAIQRHLKINSKVKGKERTLSGMEGVAGADSVLLSHCVFPTTETGQRQAKAVSIEEIRSWPHRLTGDLYKRCKKMSGIDDEEDKKEDKEGNADPGTTTQQTQQ